MYQKNGILEVDECTVFYSGFKMGDPVKCILTDRSGTVSKVWPKETVHKYDDRVTIRVTFEYTVTPEVRSHNSFRVKEGKLLIRTTDDEGNEVLLPADVYHGR